MKFGKEFSSQMVQEWQTAYMDYNTLKSLLKDLLTYRHQNQISSSPAKPGGHLRRKLSLYRAFSGLTGQYRGSPKNSEDEEVILVSAMEDEGSGNSYQTTFLKTAEDGGMKELVFFNTLDGEFNKVLKFYQQKVQEAKLGAEDLTKQMDALIALRIRVDKPTVELSALSTTESSSPATITASVNETKHGAMHHMETIQEVEMSNRGIASEENSSVGMNFRPAPLQILDHVKVNVDPDTPISTLRNVVMSSKGNNLSFSKRELRRAEEKLRNAFIEFNQQLRLLKSYCFLNMLAFSKIMKKYDKITSRSASKSYLQMVDKSYLGTSDEVNKLIERLEATFIKHFSNGNRRKGMKSLRPGQKRAKHRTTFFLGLFTGCSIALIVTIIVIVHARSLFNHKGQEKYMQNIFPLYSLFIFIILHMLMFGSNTYLWRRFRVNYPFIFGFKPGTELGFREIFLVASGLSVLAFAAAVSNLNMEMDERTQSFKLYTELVPLVLVIAVFCITICPFNIVYRSSRFFLLRCALHCICAPLYKVTLPDFFLADQLTSQVQAIRSLLFYVCYYGWGDFKTRSNNCSDSDLYEIFSIVIAIIPFWCRAVQCIRRLVEEKDSMQGLNCLKYFSTIVALVMRTIFSRRKGVMFWRVMAGTTSGVTTIFTTYWDIVIDWGLLQKDSKNPWLRDKLLISSKTVYFVAIVVNILLRLVWMQMVLSFDVPFLHEKAMIAVVACLEIIRRGIWNFFRVENEHFNNVGKYRAFNSVPLPFHYANEKIM